MARLIGSVTQGSMDAFAIANIQTALTGQTRQAYQVKEIITELPRLGAAAGSNIELCVSRRTKAAMPLISDPDVMYKIGTGVELATSGAIPYERIVRYQPPEDLPLLIVEDPLYFLIDTNATSLAQTAILVIEYDLVTISDVDRLTLLTQSLV